MHCDKLLRRLSPTVSLPDISRVDGGLLRGKVAGAHAFMQRSNREGLFFMQRSNRTELAGSARAGGRLCPLMSQMRVATGDDYVGYAIWST